MKYLDLFKKTEGDLQKLLSEKREALRTFRFNVSGSKVSNVKEARGNRRVVAQILTALKQKTNSGTV